MTIEGAELLNLASAAVLAVLAVFLLVRKGRNATTHALAVFAIGAATLYGGAFLPQGSLNDVMLAASYVATAAGIVGLVWLVPSRLDTTQAGLAIAAASVLGLSYTLGFGLTDDDWAYYRGPIAPILRALAIGVYGVYAFASVLFAYRGTRPDAEPTSIRSLAFLALGLSLFGAGLAQVWTAYAAANSASALVNLLMVTITGLAWFRFGDTPSYRSARRISLAILGVWTAATFAAFVAPEYTYPLGRILGTLLLVYAVLRGEIVGIDAKVRFTLSKTTVAAVFVGVFFAASEVAQQFFGEQFQSEYLGIAAAGLLVVAIAPLQRLADRLAEKAVPIAGAAPSAAPDRDRREKVFLKAARLALRGGLSRDEEVHLAELAEELGIGAGRAAALLREAERGARAGAA